MITKTITINGSEFRLTLTDHVIRQVTSLRELYDRPVDDPETFEQLSSEISSAIQNIMTAVDPEPDSGDYDMLVQEIMSVIDNKEAQLQKESESRPEKNRKTQ